MTLRILNLLEVMNSYNVWQLVHAVNQIRDLERLLEKQCDESGLRDYFITEPFISKFVKPCLDYCRDQCKDAELQAPVRRLGTELHGKVNVGAITHDELRLQLRELRRDIDGDLCFRRFAFIPTSRADLYDKRASTWERIWKAFPESEDDSRAAVDAYALELYTASVFHAMRVAELGIRRLARTLHVTLQVKGKRAPIVLADWNTVITAIRNEIARLHGIKPRTTAVDKRLQRYADAADRCTYMQDLWRNPVSHARQSYIEGDALAALSRVHAFMDILARGKDS